MSPYCRCRNLRLPGPHDVECPLWTPPSDSMTPDARRLKRIAEIIEAVDNRCMAADIVTPTLKEMTQQEISEIYALATRKKHGR